MDGQIAFAQDTESYYRYDSDSTSWVALLGGADITAVTITTASDSGLSGGASATSGDFTATLLIDANNLATATATAAASPTVSLAFATAHFWCRCFARCQVLLVVAAMLRLLQVQLVVPLPVLQL